MKLYENRFGKVKRSATRFPRNSAELIKMFVIKESESYAQFLIFKIEKKLLINSIPAYNLINLNLTTSCWSVDQLNKFHHISITFLLRSLFNSFDGRSLPTVTKHKLPDVN